MPLRRSRRRPEPYPQRCQGQSERVEILTARHDKHASSEPKECADLGLPGRLPGAASEDVSEIRR